jgi:hypothetical protein
LTIEKSAAANSDAIGPNAVDGSASSGAVRPVKCTSPANASVSGPSGSGVEEDEGTEEDEDAEDPAEEAGWNVGSATAHPASRPAAAARTAIRRQTFTAPG